MRGWLHSLKATYLTADPRSLGLFRLGFGLVLLADLLHRYQQLDFWYTNTGLLPNHTLLWRPPAEHMFSLFFAASSQNEATLGFVACAVVYALFTLGYRTRFLQVLVVVCRVSLNSRLAVLENGGDMVINLLALFTLALPLGRRFSLDAWLHALRSCRASNVEELNTLGRPALESEAIVSPAMLGLIMQFAAIYFFNALSKQGEAWTQGYAVHYALHQDKFVTGFGVWLREHLTSSACQYLTWSVLAAEWTGFALIITPLFVTQARLLAVLMLPCLHLAFALGLNLGTFSAAMMSFFPLLLTRSHWDALGRWLKRRAAVRVVEWPALDDNARALRELDRFGRIHWRSDRSDWATLTSGQARVRAAPRFAAIAHALPWGFAVARLLRVPLLNAALWRLLFGVFVRTARLSQSAPKAPTLTARVFASRKARWFEYAAVIALIVAIASEVVNDNTSVPGWMRFTQPAWAKAIIEYPRILQGWRMFAPEPSRYDTMIYVDATTADGVHVDPYNVVASRQGFPAGDVVPARMGQSQFFTMYSDRIPLADYAVYRQAFLEWLLSYPQRTGRPTDCLTAFDVYLVTDQSPPPGGGAQPTPLSREKFMQYTAPAGGACQSTEFSFAKRTRLH